MSRFEPTSKTNIKRHKDSGIFYFVRGKLERSLKTTDWKLAVDRADFVLSEVQGFGSGAGVKFKTLWPDFVEFKEKQSRGKVKGKKTLSEGSLKEIKSLGENYFMPFFGKKRLSEFEKNWKKFCDWAPANDLANHRKVANQFFKWAKDEGKVSKKPDITDIPYHERRRRKIIKPKELTAIFANAKGSLKVFLTLALYNGLRRKEIMTLAWDQIELEGHHIKILKGFNKRRRERSIPINDLVVSVLRAHKESQKTRTPWVFPKRGAPSQHAGLEGLKKAWMTCLKRSNLKDITWHDFRATFEKHMNKNLSFTDVQKEKFADATMDVQKKIYVSMDHEDLKGLENSVQIEGLKEIILNDSSLDEESPGAKKQGGRS